MAPQIPRRPASPSSKRAADGRHVTSHEAGSYLGCPACGRFLKIEWAVRSVVCSCGARLPVTRPAGLAAEDPRAASAWTAAVVPGLLLLVARDLALYDPPRVLAWRLSHDARLAAAASALAPLVPAPSGAWDRDPIALRARGARDDPGARVRALAAAGAARAGSRRRDRAGGGRCSWCCRAPPSSRSASRPSVPTARTAASCSCRWRSTASSPGRAPTAPTTRARCWSARRVSRASGTSSAATRSCITTPICRARTS